MDEIWEAALAEHFEVARIQAYEEINELHESLGLMPWYILTKEELELVGLCLPYKLSIYSYYSNVKVIIRKEGECIKDLWARGIKAIPWSTWNKGRAGS